VALLAFIPVKNGIELLRPDGRYRGKHVTEKSSTSPIYDMCKAIDKGMVIFDVRLVSKFKEIT
jgi:hypothetical protein